MNMHSTLSGKPVLLALAIALLGSTACETQPRRTTTDSGLRAVKPTLSVRFLQIPEEEQCSVHANMQTLIAGGNRADDDDIAACESQNANRRMPLAYEIPLSDSDPLGQLESWHGKIAEIRNKADIQIPTMDSFRLTLSYVSTKATATGGADIEIVVGSRSHKLYIDTGLPGIENYRQDAESPVRLTSGNTFRINLPFSFIRENSGVYYRSVLNYAERYFYYDLDTQQTRELTADEYSRRGRRSR